MAVASGMDQIHTSSDERDIHLCMSFGEHRIRNMKNISAAPNYAKLPQVYSPVLLAIKVIT